ncbi:MAG: hypothetical protein M1820_007626 [Bogoriella megaspora]|nr:MAG: hypothetical protein M1820_007626 [Bogoriella megaspora]
MASSDVVSLNTKESPALAASLNLDGARRTSELLTENDHKHHIFFNDSGFHNHIVHHLLTIYALGATGPTVKKQYDYNLGYQRPLLELNESVVQELHDRSNWEQYLGNGKHYHDFLAFFKQEINQKGWQNVLKEYLFARNETADDLLIRMFAGFFHPIIHLGFGIEFDQPTIIAEALAQGAVHDNWPGKLILPAEKARKEDASQNKTTIVSLLDAIHADKDLNAAVHWDDNNKVRDGILKRASSKMLSYASQYSVSPSDDLEEKTAEMINATIYFTGAAQRPGKQIKFDFYLMHCVNCSIFFTAFLKQEWLPREDKARLLEWKVWNDLALYASRKSPDLLLDEIRNYKPKRPSGWEGVFERVREFLDDGHGSKLVRTLAHGEKVSRPYEQQDGFRIKGDMFLTLGHMVIDSVEAPGDHWVRSAGFDEAWEGVGPRAQL